MSEMEYNKGRLVKELRSIKEVAEDEIILYPKYCNSERYYDIEDKRSSQESVDKIGELYKMFEEYCEIDCRGIV